MTVCIGTFERYALWGGIGHTDPSGLSIPDDLFFVRSECYFLNGVRGGLYPRPCSILVESRTRRTGCAVYQPDRTYVIPKRGSLNALP